jgi:hypothetical protein
LLAQPGIEHARNVAPQRSAARLSPLAPTTDMRAASEHYVLAAKRNQFRDPQARLNGDEQEGAVAAANPGGGIRSRKERLDFLGRQKLDEPALESLARNREHPLAQQCMCGLGQSHVVEEAVDGRQPCVAGASAIAALPLEVVEELGHERRVEVLDGESRRWFVKARSREAQE